MARLLLSAVLALCGAIVLVMSAARSTAADAGPPKAPSRFALFAGANDWAWAGDGLTAGDAGLRWTDGFATLAVDRVALDRTLAAAQTGGRTDADLRVATLGLSDLPNGFVLDTEGYLESARTAGIASYGRFFSRRGPPSEIVEFNLLGSQARTPRDLANDKLGQIERALNISGTRPPGEPIRVGDSTNGWSIFFVIGGSGGTQLGAVIAWQQLDISVVMGYLTSGTSEPSRQALERYVGTQAGKITALLRPLSAPVTSAPPATTPVAITAPPVTSAPPVSAPPSTAPPVLSPPMPPSNLRATETGRTSLRFAWSAAAGAETYWVYAPDDGGYRRVDGAVTSISLEGLAPESYHCLIVIAQNAAGYSGWSNWACASTAP